MSKASPAEALLKKIRKLDANRICPNCGTESSTNLGFGSVCVKFKTFICDLCKTSHQAISHRVKSVSMSEWTMEEVKQLTTERMGGNEVALHVWLGNAPPVGGRYAGGRRPKKGDGVEVFKQFILDCYEYQKFKSDIPFTPSAPGAQLSNEEGGLVSSKPVATVPAAPMIDTTSWSSTATSGTDSFTPSKPSDTTASLLDMDDDVFGTSSAGHGESTSNSGFGFMDTSGGKDHFSEANTPVGAGSGAPFDPFAGFTEPLTASTNSSNNNVPSNASTNTVNRAKTIDLDMLMSQNNNMIGQSRGGMGQHSSMMGQTNNMMGTMGQTNNMMGTMGQTNNMMGQNNNMMGQSNNMMGMMGQSRGGMGQNNNMMGQSNSMRSQNGNMGISNMMYDNVNSMSGSMSASQTNAAKAVKTGYANSNVFDFVNKELGK